MTQAMKTAAADPAGAASRRAALRLIDAVLRQGLPLEAALAEQALVVVERASRDGEPAWPAGVTLDARRSYGDTTVWFATRDD